MPDNQEKTPAQEVDMNIKPGDFVAAEDIPDEETFDRIKECGFRAGYGAGSDLFPDWESRRRKTGGMAWVFDRDGDQWWARIEGEYANGRRLYPTDIGANEHFASLTGEAQGDDEHHLTPLQRLRAWILGIDAKTISDAREVASKEHGKRRRVAEALLRLVGG